MSPRTLSRVASQAIDVGREDLALRLYTRLIQSGDIKSHDYGMMSQAFENAGRLAEARDALERGLADGCEDPVLRGILLCNLGCLLLKAGQAAVALDRLRESVVILGEKPGFGEVHYFLGKALVAQGARAAALEAFRKGIQHASDNEQLYYAAASVLPNSERVERVELLQRAVELKPDYGVALELLGEDYLALRRIDEAIVVLSRLVDLYPRYVWGMVFLAEALIQGNRLDAAEKQLRAAEAEEPRESAIHWQLGAVFERKHMLKEAEVALRRAVQCDPKCPEAVYFLAKFLLRQRSFAEGRELLCEVLRLQPDRPDREQIQRWVDELKA